MYPPLKYFHKELQTVFRYKPLLSAGPLRPTLVPFSLVKYTLFRMPAHEPDYRQRLNNELQRIGDLVNLRYEFATIGPLHEATWRATARSKRPYLIVLLTNHIAVWGIPYGVGNGHTKSEAKEAAAQAAYFKLLARG